MGKDLGPISEVFECIHKKLKCNLNCLICFFAGIISLGIIGYAIKQFDSQLFEKRSLKFTKEFWVTVGYQLSREALVNKVKPDEKRMGPFLGYRGILSFN